MTDPRQLVETYLNAFYAGDPAARKFLADDFHFSGPSAHFHGADAFLKGAGHAAAGTQSVEIDKTFASGGEVAAFYTLHLDHRVGRIRIAERFRVADDRIAESTLIMDTAPFMTRQRLEAPNVAIDPVCHMEVDKRAPAATRMHDGTTYYFCSPGCAEAFARAPQDYLAA
jgi:YHS domain-containing protein